MNDGIIPCWEYSRETSGLTLRDYVKRQVKSAAETSTLTCPVCKVGVSAKKLSSHRAKQHGEDANKPAVLFGCDPA